MQYILDTSILISAPDVIKLPKCKFIIPFVVIKELDKHKIRKDEVGHNARSVIRFLDSLRKVGNLSEGVITSNGSIFIIDGCNDVVDSFDEKVLQCAKKYPEAVLLSNDTGMRVAASAMNIRSNDYVEEDDITTYTDIFRGWREIELTQEDIAKLFNDGKLANKFKLIPNEFVLIKNISNKSNSALGRYDAVRGCIVPVTSTKKVVYGIKPRNVEQKFAMELLLNDDIKLVTFVGRSGTGKTLLSLAAGLHKLEEGSYKKIIVCRSIIPIGNDIGYLPGNMDEKMTPWMGSIYDNLNFMFENAGESEKDGRKLKIGADDLINKIEITPLTYLRGRSLTNTWFILEEAQNTTAGEIKSIITRAGEGTKVILTGDIEQIDHPHLDQYNNGLSYVVDRFKGQNIYGHILMTKTERSKLADLASELL